MSFNFRGKAIDLPSKLFINGEWIETESKLPVYCPELGKEIHGVSLADVSHVNAAVEAARACVEGPEWGIATTGTQRAVFIREIARIIEERKDRIVALESIDVGKPASEAVEDVNLCVAALNYLAKQTEAMDAKQGVVVIPEIAPDFTSRVFYEPVGVVACITPWNFPFLMAIQKAGAALAAGNAVILKPSENTTLTTLEFASVCEAAKLPKGAINIVTGFGQPVGQALIDHPVVDMISFTGSVPTGTNVMKAAANGVRRVHLELGGKSAMVVLEDADADAAVDWILLGIFYNSGQVCSATSRVLVHESLWEKVSTAVVRLAKEISVGPPKSDADEDHRMGPIINKIQFDKVLGFIERARAAGLNVATGGARVEGVEGLFIQPTIIVNPPEDAEAWTEEIFGPVLCMRPFSSDAEAIKVANASRFGLGASVMGSEEKAMRVCAKLKAGTVWVNNNQPVFPETAFGGYKQSGFGRELGEHAVDEFMNAKQVTGAPRGYCWNWFAPKL